MILADTSVWVDHLRKNDANLTQFLERGLVLMHPFVVGELACGNLKNRSEILSLLAVLPPAKAAEHDEVLHLVAQHELQGKGLGWIDAHLLASTLLTGCTLWTRDRSLTKAARNLGVDA